MERDVRRKFFGIVVTMDILSSRELTAAEKLIYSYITSYTASICYDSNERIASRLGLSARTVTRSLMELQNKSYVFVEFGKGNTSHRKIYDVFNKPKKLKFLAKRAEK